MTGIELAVVIAAASVGAFVKGVTGLGFPLVGVPLISLFLGVEDAVVIMAFPSVMANLWQIATHRRALRGSQHLRPLAGFSVVGAMVGAQILLVVDEDVLAAFLALAICSYIAMFVREPELQLGERARSTWSPLVGFAGGVMQGAIGIAGPVFATWMHAFRLGRSAYVASISLLFLIAGSAQIASLAALGLFTVDRAVASAVATLPLILLVPIGDRVGRRLPAATFERAALVVLGGSVITLVAKMVT